MLGIDIYDRYQDVTSWGELRDALIRPAPGREPEPIGFVYVKATDGVGPAAVKADGFVIGARSVGFPVGVYHFAQPGSPEFQADLITSEARRLRTTLPPMLDLEDNPLGSGRANIPDSQKTAWAQAFLRRVAAVGHRPVVYLSSALAKVLRPDHWDIPGLVIWIASYGPNNGSRNALTGGYPGRVDIHQYTSVGRVAGIAGGVDLSEAFVDLTEEADVGVEWDKRYRFGRTGYETELGNWIGETNVAANDTRDGIARVEAKLDIIAGEISSVEAEIVAAVREQRNPDTPPLTDEQVTRLGSILRDGLGEVVSETLGRKLIRKDEP